MIIIECHTIDKCSYSHNHKKEECYANGYIVNISVFFTLYETFTSEICVEDQADCVYRGEGYVD